MLSPVTSDQTNSPLASLDVMARTRNPGTHRAQDKKHGLRGAAQLIRVVMLACGQVRSRHSAWLPWQLRTIVAGIAGTWQLDYEVFGTIQAPLQFCPARCHPIS